MSEMSRSARDLAVAWIEAWKRKDMEAVADLLAPDFVHVSPFGRLEGRETYLATVEPLARRSVLELSIVDAVGEEDRAAIWFENRTPGGAIPTCDWIRIEGGRIREVRSFYDPAAVRESLTPEAQRELEGGA